MSGSSRSRITPSAADQAPGMLDDVLEDLGRLAQDRDPGRDLPQGLLRLGAPAQRITRTVELLDQAGRA